MVARIQISNLSPPWYLVSLGRLVDAGREDEAYQLVLTGIALHPESAELRVAAAYVASLLGRCSLAEHHLAAVKELPTCLIYMRIPTNQGSVFWAMAVAIFHFCIDGI